MNLMFNDFSKNVAMNLVIFPLRKKKKRKEKTPFLR